MTSDIDVATLKQLSYPGAAIILPRPPEGEGDGVRYFVSASGATYREVGDGRTEAWFGKHGWQPAHPKDHAARWVPISPAEAERLTKPAEPEKKMSQFTDAELELREQRARDAAEYTTADIIGEYLALRRRTRPVPVGERLPEEGKEAWWKMEGVSMWEAGAVIGGEVMLHHGGPYKPTNFFQWCELPGDPNETEVRR